MESGSYHLGTVGQPVTEPASGAPWLRDELRASTAWLCGRPHVPDLEQLQEREGQYSEELFSGELADEGV